MELSTHMIDTEKITSALSEYLNERYEVGSAIEENGFDAERIPFIWAERTFKETKAGIYISELETDKSKIIIYAMYWTRYGQIKVNKNKAVAGWSVKIPQHKVGIPINMEIYFEEAGCDDILAHFDVFYSGATAKTTYLIDSFGNVSFYGYKQGDSSFEESSRYFGTLIECPSKTLSEGIETISGMLKRRIAYIIEDNNLLSE